MSSNIKTYDSLHDIATSLKQELTSKKYVLIFAYNGTGKTRLSCEFKNIAKSKSRANPKGDTLYYNAFTEDLFNWNNDLEHDTERFLHINKDSRFFEGLRDLSMEEKIRNFLGVYADFDFRIDYDKWIVAFSRKIKVDDSEQTLNNIKISRAEEYIFIWCFFLAIVQLVIDKHTSYNWVKYIYIDDPISSLDDNNAILVGSQLAQLLQKHEDLKVIISTHHSLFFNVMFNEFKNKKGKDYMLIKDVENSKYITRDIGDTPFFYHVSLLKELKKAAASGQLYTYHFNILRNILEKTASFHGYKDFGDCLKEINPEIDNKTYNRYVNILSHGNYSLYEPKVMVDDNKKIFKDILEHFLKVYRYNPDLFKDLDEAGEADE